MCAHKLWNLIVELLLDNKHAERVGDVSVLLFQRHRGLQISITNYHMLTIIFYLTSTDINTMKEAAHEITGFKLDVCLWFAWVCGSMQCSNSVQWKSEDINSSLFYWIHRNKVELNLSVTTLNWTMQILRLWCCFLIRISFQSKNYNYSCSLRQTLLHKQCSQNSPVVKIRNFWTIGVPPNKNYFRVLGTKTV